MKLSFLLSSLLCAVFSSAQFISEGGQPGQQQRFGLFDDPPHVPSSAQTFHSGADEPSQAAPAVVSLFEKMGVDFTEAIPAPTVQSPWDPRIPLITDENFDEVITHEELTPEEETERVWFLIISMPKGKNSEISKLVDQSFDEAHNQTLAAGDLLHVRWGRIDYTNTTFLTTKWAIWSGPYLIVATDRGETLRFYKADRAHVTPELLRELLTEGLWRHTQPWKTEFAPGGLREWVLHYCASGLMHTSHFVNRYPRWQLFVGASAIVLLVMRARRAVGPSTATMAEHRLQPTEGGTSESSSAVATSKALFGSMATSTATASPSRGATSTEAKKVSTLQKLKR